MKINWVPLIYVNSEQMFIKQINLWKLEKWPLVLWLFPSTSDGDIALNSYKKILKLSDIVFQLLCQKLIKEICHVIELYFFIDLSLSWQYYRIKVKCSLLANHLYLRITVLLGQRLWKNNSQLFSYMCSRDYFKI